MSMTVWPLSKIKQRSFYMNIHTIAHTTWNCKYHVVLAPQYRRKAFYGGRRLEIGAKGIGIIEAEVCPDHIHMLLEIPPKYSVSKERVVSRYMNGGEMQNSDIKTENFGVKRTMSILQGRTLRK